jgi:hypothetical protein
MRESERERLDGVNKLIRSLEKESVKESQDFDSF